MLSLVLLASACGTAARTSHGPTLGPEAAKAAEALAGFDLSCEPEELSMQAFHERRAFDTLIVLVGAAGCGRRSYYEVRCAGPNCRAEPLTSIRSLW